MKMRQRKWKIERHVVSIIGFDTCRPSSIAECTMLYLLKQTFTFSTKLIEIFQQQKKKKEKDFCFVYEINE